MAVIGRAMILGKMSVMILGERLIQEEEISMTREEVVETTTEAIEEVSEVTEVDLEEIEKILGVVEEAMEVIEISKEETTMLQKKDLIIANPIIGEQREGRARVPKIIGEKPVKKIALLRNIYEMMKDSKHRAGEVGQINQ